MLLLSLLSGCDNAPNDSKDMGQIMGNSAQGYAKVVPNKPITFPQDHLAHNDFKQEWWYLTANLTTASGEAVGIQWTQFRIALSPPDSEPTMLIEQSQSSPASSKNKFPALHSQWQTRQVYMAHAALTSKTQHFNAEKWSRGNKHLAAVSSNPFTIFTQNWRWQSDNNDMFPAQLRVEQPEFGFQLQLDSQQPFQRQGDNGYSIKSADSAVASYYYSQPYINVSGTINRHGKSEIVTGKAWLDREWSSQFLTKAQQGWDWFSLRLNAQQTLMIFRLRGNNDAGHFYSARLMNADGHGSNINSKDQPNDIRMTPTQWQQTQTGRHPIAWHIQVTSANIDITTSALNSNSDMPLSVSYWEGPIQFSGSHQGEGYMELTGYQ
ncbi:lipocalin-like domain-containing protein [Shewanella intestini]|uniref:Carotenoid 1,2-hydratase n=1 Tax=Shewanella intestini TaxID=2017544 RepID=A0ABS5I5B6_9GAMM|nr:carotenoid 1,2-hydratase [Shewanella intestini]MRG37223.1 carotenoid 1,2-hydratase [Shewanella sp. XMDDZSB0408]